VSITLLDPRMATIKITGHARNIAMAINNDDRFVVLELESITISIA